MVNYPAKDREMDDPITKIQWGLRGAQVAFAFFCMALIAAMVSFDNEYTSSHILPNIEIFIAVLSMPFAAAIVVVPYVYQRKGKLKALAVALRHVRFELVLSAIWACLWAVVSLANSIYLGVRDCDPDDPQFNKTRKEHGDAFSDRLASKCNVGRVGLVFGWLALLAWVGSVALVAKEWYDNRRPTNQQKIRPTGVSQMSSVSVQETGLPAGTSLEEYKSQKLGSPQPQQSQTQQPLPPPPPPQSPPMPGYTSPPAAFSSPQYPPAPLPPPIPQSHISPLQIPAPHQQSTSTTKPEDVSFPMPHFQ